LVWIDCEMTGLDLARDALIEVAVVVTDKDLVPLGEGLDVIVKPPPGAVERMDPFVRQMHDSSGLLAELDSGGTMAQAETAVLDHVRRFVPEAGKAPLAGNTIGTDRSFLARDMPTLEAHLHYRNVDVSSLKELARRWYPRIFFSAPEKGGQHRALADILESIEELRYYREAMFVPPPGPERADLLALAAKHRGALAGLSRNGDEVAPAGSDPGSSPDDEARDG
jgi:oligoribonuclease